MAEQDRTRSEVGNRSTMQLVRDTLIHVSGLVRSEVDLARAEVSENLNKAVGALITLALALVFAIVALNTLSAALVGLIAEFLDLDAVWASLIVFAVFALIAVICLARGRSALSAKGLAPTRTAKNIQRDTQTVREATR